ncbi:hypothetical protein HOO65_090239 [Ceratocystis lukuohia]|uniref:Uncharacterized protein n=1 Tax=Ceratocystis lukuohia TaxID=2019550 RepID=A0ABR4M9M8_9PEZI
MRFFSASLPMALSLLGLAQAGLLEDHGYRRMSSGDIEAVFFADGSGNSQLMDIISFHPWMKMATLYVADDEIEPEHPNKLSLSEIYNALAEEHNRLPSAIDWIVTEVAGDEKIGTMIAEIREGRKLGPNDEVVIIPGDMEWNAILDTDYYMNAALVNRKAIDKVIIRTTSRTMFDKTFDISSMHFHFPGNTFRKPGTEPIASADGTTVSDTMKWEDVWNMEYKKMSKMVWENEEEEALALKDFMSKEDAVEVSSLADLYTSMLRDVEATEESEDAPVSRI